MQLFGKHYTPDALRRCVGNMDQIAAIRTVQLDDGNERPTRAAIIHTGSGLELTVLLDRCLDIAAASYCGKAMGWRSTCGDVAPQYYEAEGIRWLRSYGGGLVATCGLMNVGAPLPESALLGTGLHGRIGNAPARNIKITQEWQGDKYVLSVSGEMRETVVFGENLTLIRTVSTELGSSSFTVQDTVRNDGFSDTKYQLLYHCNFGWPVVDAGSEMVVPAKQIAARDAEATGGKEKWFACDGPIHQYKEKVYYLDVTGDAKGFATTAILNDGFKNGNGFGAYLKYNVKELPRFVIWKQMGEQDYVVGFEPCNCGVEGRHVDEALGLLHTLKPGQSKNVTLEFGAVTDAKHAAAIRKGAGARPKFVESYKQFVKKPR